jgi:hypothetical protein
LIHVLIETEQGSETRIHPVDAFVLLAALCALVATFLVARIIKTGSVFGLTIPDRFRTLTAIGLLILLPQSTILYGRISQLVTNDVTLFTVCNILDIAFGRLLLVLFQKRPLLPPPRGGGEHGVAGRGTHTKLPGRDGTRPVPEPLSREIIRSGLPKH